MSGIFLFDESGRPVEVFPNANGMSYSRGAYRWERSSGDLPVPLDAVQASSEVNRGPIYAGRAYHERDLLPAKVIPSHGCAYISYHGEEFRKVEYEVLCSENVAWDLCEGRSIPPEAIRIGMTADGDPQCMGRTLMADGSQIPGKVLVSDGCLYVQHNGAELKFISYEILVLS